MSGNDDPAERASEAARSRLEELVGRLRYRVNVQTGLDRATTAGVVAVMVSSLALVLWKTHWIAFGDFAFVALATLVFPAAAFASSWLSERDPVELAQRLDRSHELHDRLSTALALVRSERSDEFSVAQLRDALEHADAVEPERAAPYRRPGDVPLLVAFLAAFAVLAMLRPPSHAHPLPDPPQIKHDPVLDSATLAMEKEQVEEMKEKLEGTDNPRTQKLVDDLDKLLEDVEKRRISGHEFLDRLDKLEKKHFEGKKAQGSGDSKPEESLSETLKKAAEELEKEAGKELDKEKDLKEVAEALKNEDLDKASKSLEKLADKLLDDKKEIDPEQLKRMAKLLEKFSDNLEMDDKKLEKMLEKHKDLVDKLSEKLKNKGELSQGEKQRLNRAKKKARELQKKLDNKNRAKQKRQLKKLRRKTKQAAKDMKKASKKKKKKSGDKNNDKGKKKKDKKSKQNSKYKKRAGRKMKKSSKQMEKEAKKKKSREVKQAARKQLEELRRSMKRSRPRQAKKSGDQGGSSNSKSDSSGEKGEKMREFLRKASGKKGSKQAKKGKKGSSGESSKDQKGEQSSPDSETGRTSSGESKNSKKQGSSDKPGDRPGGPALGEESEEMKTKREKERASGRKGSGPSRSKVIRSASEKGFANREYKDVYGDYSSVVEEVMKREDVPSGYRYYVKRYFELIKPRD